MPVVSVWEPGKATLLWKSGKRSVRTGKVRGPLMVHRPLGDLEGYSLTHTPTGMHLATLEREEEAMKMGDLLLGKCLSQLMTSDVGRIVERVPREVQVWVKMCHHLGRVVDGG